MLWCMRKTYVSMKRVPVATGRHVVDNQLIAKAERAKGKTNVLGSINLIHQIFNEGKLSIIDNLGLFLNH